MLRKINFIIALLCAMPLSMVSQSDAVFVLSRLSHPDKGMVQEQRSLQKKRAIYKYALTGLVATAVGAGLYASFKIQASVDGDKFDKVKKLLESSKDVIAGESNGWLTSLTCNFKNACVAVASLFASTIAYSTTNLIIGGVYQSVARNLQMAYSEESLLWFVQTLSDIEPIFAALKSQTVEYDLHSALLSAEMFSQDYAVHAKAFVQDVVDAASQRSTGNDPFMDGYADYLLEAIKKKYTSRSQSFENLQEEMLPYVACKDRVCNNKGPVDLFNRDGQHRQDIADLCTFLVENMKKMLAFVQLHNHKQSHRIMDLIHSCNLYIQQMESMLNMSSQQLQEMSKAQQGMFTLTYEYHQLFTQEITFLHKHCKITQ